jgi:hypothetical protein
MSIHILFCENGQHSWERESRRGRLPKSCPDHPDEKDIKVTSGAILRPNPTQGYIDYSSGVPTVIPVEKSHVAHYEINETSQEIINNSDLLNQLKAATEKPTTRILHCEIGDHDWEAPRQRGRAPRNCPEHAPAAQKPAQRESNTKNQGILLAAILEKPGAASCNCGITSDSSPADLRQMRGCRDPFYVCTTLDSCRRAVGI